MLKVGRNIPWDDACNWQWNFEFKNSPPRPNTDCKVSTSRYCADNWISLSSSVYKLKVIILYFAHYERFSFVYVRRLSDVFSGIYIYTRHSIYKQTWFQWNTNTALLRIIFSDLAKYSHDTKRRAVSATAELIIIYVVISAWPCCILDLLGERPCDNPRRPVRGGSLVKIS